MPTAEPTEEEHFQAYREVVEAMGQRTVVIRTLDLGADKMGHLPRIEDEHNPVPGTAQHPPVAAQRGLVPHPAARHPACQCLGDTSRSSSR